MNAKESQPQSSSRGAVERIPSPHAKRMKLDSGEAAAYVPSKQKVRDQYGRLTPNSPEDFYYHLSPALKLDRKKYLRTNELKKAGRGQRDLLAVNSPTFDRLQQFMAIVALPATTPS